MLYTNQYAHKVSAHACIHLSASALLASVLIGLTLTLAACSGTGTSNTWRSEVGRAPGYQLISSVIADEMSSFGYQIRTADRRALETNWRTRRSSGTEALENADRVRDRAFVTYINRGTSTDEDVVANMRIEYEVRKEGEWIPAEPPPGAVEEYEEIIDRIRNRLRRYSTQN